MDLVRETGLETAALIATHNLDYACRYGWTAMKQGPCTSPPSPPRAVSTPR
jgi:hypothetical protein